MENQLFHQYFFGKSILQYYFELSYTRRTRFLSFMIILGNFNLELLSENVFYLEKRSVNHYVNLHKTIYYMASETKFSKISETIYMAKHIYGGAPLYVHSHLRTKLMEILSKFSAIQIYRNTFV